MENIVSRLTPFKPYLDTELHPDQRSRRVNTCLIIALLYAQQCISAEFQFKSGRSSQRTYAHPDSGFLLTRQCMLLCEHRQEQCVYQLQSERKNERKDPKTISIRVAAQQFARYTLCGHCNRWLRLPVFDISKAILNGHVECSLNAIL